MFMMLTILRTRLIRHHPRTFSAPIIFHHYAGWSHAWAGYTDIPERGKVSCLMHTVVPSVALLNWHNCRRTTFHQHLIMPVPVPT